MLFISATRGWLLLIIMALFGAGLFKTNPITENHLNLINTLHTLCGTIVILTFPVDKATGYAELLHELPVGLNEWAVHPGLDSAELLAMEPDDKHNRQTDFEFLMSQQAKDIVREEGFILVDYRLLQEFWRHK